MLGTILIDVNGITLGVYVGTDLGSLYGCFYGSNYGRLEIFILGYQLRYSDGNVLGSDEVIKLGLSDGKVLSIILVDVDGITFWIDVGTDLVSVDVFFVVSNDGDLEILLFGDILVSTDVKVLRTLPENSNGITVWLDVGSGLSSLN